MKELDLEFEIENVQGAAREFLDKTKGYRVFAFTGELGAGKTTFIASLCKELGVEEIVTSPTFAIIQQYDSPLAGKIYHLDFYRINSNDEAINSGLEDCILSNHLCMVEWPQNAPGIFPDDTVMINITITGDTRRKMQIQLPE